MSGSLPASACTYEYNVHNNETWSFARGKGVTLVFERFHKVVVMSRKGHPPGDATLALVGTVSRTAVGGYNEQGPPPCRGSFPSNQDSCNTSFPVNSPLGLYLSKHGLLTLDRPAGQQLIPLDSSDNPARLCGSDDQNPDTAWFTYDYPYLIKTELGVADKKELFGKKHVIRLSGSGRYELNNYQAFSNTEEDTTDVDLRLIREGD